MIAPTLPQPVVVRPDGPAAFVFNKMRCGADVVAAPEPCRSGCPVSRRGVLSES